MSADKNQIQKIVNGGNDEIKFLATVVKDAHMRDLNIVRIFKLIIRGIEADPLSVFTNVGKRLAIHQDLIDEMVQAENISEFINQHLTIDKLPPDANDTAHLLFNLVKKLIGEEQDQTKCRRYANSVDTICNLYIDYLTLIS